MKKSIPLFSFVLALILLLPFFSASAAADGYFKDVGEKDWFVSSVNYVFGKGLRKGVSDDKFDPGGSLTRGMCVTVLYRVAGEPDTAGEIKFVDVKGGEYYAEPILWASNSGIVYGRTETAFVPEGTITRAEFSAMLYRYMNATDLTAPKVRDGAPSDFASIPEYARAAVASMYRAGIINGKEGRRFDPHARITRAETASMIERFSKNAVPAAEPVDPEAPTFSASSTAASPGETVEVTVSVENNPGFCALSVGFEYDKSVLVLNGVSLSEGVPGEFVFFESAAWVNGSDYTENGDLLVLSFTVKEGTPPGVYRVKPSFKTGGVSNFEEENVTFAAVPGKISVP